MAAVLLIEDDPRIREALARALTERGHAVSSSSTGMTGLREAIDGRPDLVVLDLGLPDMDGRELLKMLRAVSEVPVIVATAQDDENEIVALLNGGADDYVVKPFSGAQLDARIGALLRRTDGTGTPQPIVVGDLQIDPRTREARLGVALLDLTRKEFELLLYLAERCGTVVTKRELQADVWRQPYGGGEKTIDVHLSSVRRKLGETAAAPRYLRGLRGVGVRLVDPDQ